MAVLPIALAQSIAALELVDLRADAAHYADGAGHEPALARAAVLITLQTAPVAMLGGFAPLMQRYPHLPADYVDSE